MDKIVLFDGECHFCNRSVQFIIKRDPNAYYKFASIKSDIGQQFRKDYGIPFHIDSLILIENEQYYVKSSAALRICKNLKGAWKTGGIFLLIPTPIRNFAYDFIAKNRYKWFGKKEACELPSSEMKKRFL